ncbi:Tex-like N-terminal domain-containing protein [Faecalibaculum rodentium]|uniref:Tex-like N-terminal domain-containing protein n=1 Tax=Faecalibaculum rodentium TaxID=1702221 RepID=UPI00261CAE8C|nr:Tex family protein [Faecalibaculum rodentium]
MTQQIAGSMGLKEGQVAAVLELLEGGATIPFIARYRKEVTGRLDEDQLRRIQQVHAYTLGLQARKESVRELIGEKGLMTPELDTALKEAKTLAEVEELYRPFKEKRNTTATQAIADGHGPLADRILAQDRPFPADEDPSALQAAGWIVAEKFSDDPKIRETVKNFLEKTGVMESKKKKDAVDEKGVYEMYYDFADPVRKIPGHRVLAMERGEKEKILSIALEFDYPALEQRLARQIIRRPDAASWLSAVMHDALVRLIVPSVRRQIRSELREKACNAAIAGFSVNLENMLMTRPLKGKSVLAWDPGYVHGCKLAMLDPSGNLLATDVVYPFRGKGQEAQAIRRTRELLTEYRPDVVVIGNGTASRESEALVADIIREFPEISYVIGSEAGASVYSASQLAKEEFPDLAVETRSAVSIGRRVQDPLSELVKIDPKSLGIGEYQHDVPQKQLKEALDFVTDKAVNRVGTDVNTASPSLLMHVSGLTKTQIARILRARPIRTRTQLESVLTPKAYEQAVGFLRIPDGVEPLDATGIHPESYGFARQFLQDHGLDAADMRSQAFRDSLKRINPVQEARRLGVGTDTMIDIIRELRNPGLDPRDSLDAPVLKKDVLSIEDLVPGMELQGTVRNVTSFGAFVDIGLHDDGLVHISRMADHFVKDPREVAATGQIVKVWVHDIDRKRGRVGLSLTAPKR